MEHRLNQPAPEAYGRGAPANVPRPPRFVLLKRVLISAATAFLAVNLVTGAPVFALWVGSRVVGNKQLTMLALFLVVLALAVAVLAIALALTNLNARYDRLTGRRTRERRLTWLRSMRDEDWRDELGRPEGVTMLERIVMVTVWLAVIALVVWFFAFAGSPLGH